MTWPLGAAPGGVYTIQRPEAIMNKPALDIVLPDNFTLVVAPDVQEVKWTVNSLTFGVNCTFDLSAPQDPPIAPAEPPFVIGQKGYWEPGDPGLNGSAGLPGHDGIRLTLNVNAIGSAGALWLRTDGGPGGAGGKGARGGGGGGTKCDGTSHLTGAPGGRGGLGGTGGAGGKTSNVSITNKSYAAGYEDHPVASAVSGGRSTRPANANVDDGSVVVWGGPGCGGPNGTGGDGGPADHSTPVRQCYSFPFGNYFVRAGDDGPVGGIGAIGQTGGAHDVVIKGP